MLEYVGQDSFGSTRRSKLAQTTFPTVLQCQLCYKPRAYIDVGLFLNTLFFHLSVLVYEYYCALITVVLYCLYYTGSGSPLKVPL